MNENEDLKVDLESLPAFVARLDERQQAQERRLGRVEKNASYAVKLGEENKVAVAGMPEAFRTVLREEREDERQERRGKRMEVKEWLLLALGIIVLIISLPAAIESVQSIWNTRVEKEG